MLLKPIAQLNVVQNIMRIKTITVISITALLTIFLMQNTDSVNFSFLWADFRISKLVMMTAVSVTSFIIGVLVGRPKRVKKFGGNETDIYSGNIKTNTLSDEDKNYIN